MLRFLLSKMASAPPQLLGAAVLAAACSAPEPATPATSPTPVLVAAPPAPHAGADGSSAADTPDPHLVPRSQICVTAGRVRSAPDARHHSVDIGGMRAVVAEGSGDGAEMTFRYAGPSSSSIPLSNGELRRQVGLKLRAQDTCNVVYVMWHVAPTQGIFVAVKHNPGQSIHEECGDQGYIPVPPAVRGLPPVGEGETHRLRAEINGAVLAVFADGTRVWEGRLPAEAFLANGPVGVRSDNLAFDFELRVDDPPSAPCTTSR
jgi:hypothetical protein